MNEMMNTNTEPTCACGRGCLTGMGLLNMMLGFIAMGSPAMAGTAAKGLAAFLGGALGIAGGALILARPLFGLALLALILAVYFVVDGIARMVSAFQARPIPGWGFVLFSGMISLLLGLMIWRGWPLSGLWAIGILVGIRIFMAGLTMLLLGTGVKPANIQPSNEGDDS